MQTSEMSIIRRTRNEPVANTPLFEDSSRHEDFLRQMGEDVERQFVGSENIIDRKVNPDIEIVRVVLELWLANQMDAIGILEQ